MMRLIDADALLEKINYQGRFAEDDELYLLVKNAPTVQREGWVSVADKLPEPNTRVLVLRDSGTNIKNPKHIGYPNKTWIEISSLTENNYFMCDIVDTGITICWQPLPAAPTDKD